MVGPQDDQTRRQPRGQARLQLRRLLRCSFSVIKLSLDKKEASQALGLPVDLFSVRLIAAPRGPNSTDYLEVWLQPIASLPTKDLGISVIFRDSDRVKFEATSTQLETRILKLLESAFRKTRG